MTPSDAIKDINDLKLELSEKLELGNELTDYAIIFFYIFIFFRLKNYKKLDKIKQNTFIQVPN